MFQYNTTEVKNIVINSELKLFKTYVIENFIFLFLQSLGMLFCLNIGFLYFKIKASFINLLNLISFSLFSVFIYQLLIVFFIKLNNWTYTMGSISAMSEKFNLGSFINVEKTAPWIKLSLVSINFEQLLILILLGMGMNKILKIKYSRAFFITIRTYGLGILLWFVFAMVMEMNLS